MFLTDNLLNSVINYPSPTRSDITSRGCFSPLILNLIVYPRCVVSTHAISKYITELISSNENMFSLFVPVTRNQRQQPRCE